MVVDYTNLTGDILTIGSYTIPAYGEIVFKDASDPLLDAQVGFTLSKRIDGVETRDLSIVRWKDSAGSALIKPDGSESSGGGGGGSTAWNDITGKPAVIAAGADAATARTVVGAANNDDIFPLQFRPNIVYVVQDSGGSGAVGVTLGDPVPGAPGLTWQVGMRRLDTSGPNRGAVFEIVGNNISVMVYPALMSGNGAGNTNSFVRIVVNPYKNTTYWKVSNGVVAIDGTVIGGPTNTPVEYIPVIAAYATGQAAATVTIGSQVSGATAGVTWQAGNLVAARSGAQIGAIYEVQSDGTKVIKYAAGVSKDGMTNFVRFVSVVYGQSCTFTVTAGIVVLNNSWTNNTNGMYHLPSGATNPVSLLDHLNSIPTVLPPIVVAAAISTATQTFAVGTPMSQDSGTNWTNGLTVLTLDNGGTADTYGGANFGTFVPVANNTVRIVTVLNTATTNPGTNTQPAGVYCVHKNSSGVVTVNNSQHSVSAGNVYFNAYYNLRQIIGDIDAIDWAAEVALAPAINEVLTVAQNAANKANKAVNVTTHSGSTTTLTINGSVYDYVKIDPLQVNISTISFNNVPPAWTCAIQIKQDATGGRTMAFPSSFKWEGGIIPTLSTAANAIDLLTITTFDGGTTWQAILSKDRK